MLLRSVELRKTLPTRSIKCYTDSFAAAARLHDEMNFSLCISGIFLLLRHRQAVKLRGAPQSDVLLVLHDSAPALAALSSSTGQLYSWSSAQALDASSHAPVICLATALSMNGANVPRGLARIVLFLK